MAEAAMIEEEVNVPEGGIADFIMDDADADAIYGADEEVTSGGIGQFTEVAQEMAAAGREGDDVIAHLETGELIIPKAFLAFSQLSGGGPLNISRALFFFLFIFNLHPSKSSLNV